eukprot:5757043-Pyramimonas_sp.AAC.1
MVKRGPVIKITTLIDRSGSADRTAIEHPDRSIKGWDIVDVPSLPPPPSREEDVEHWARAMIIDASDGADSPGGTPVRER